MEEEAQKLRQFTEEAESQNAVREEVVENSSSKSPITGQPSEDSMMDEDPAIVDARSIYVGNVSTSSSA
jgi:hypothetical protein